MLLLSLPWSLIVGCNEKVSITHLDQGFTQQLSLKILKRNEGLWSYSEIRFLRSQSETFTAVNLVTSGTG